MSVSESKRGGESRTFSRTRVARIPTAMFIFCCHKCHTRVQNGSNKTKKKGKTKGQKARFSLLFHRDSVLYISRFVEIYLKYMFNLLFISGLWWSLWHLWQQKDKNSCECARTRVRARESDYRYFYNCKESISSERFPIDLLQFQHFSQNDPSFEKSDVSFYEKQHVVLCKTSRCFMKNHTLFCEKHYVVLWWITCWWKNCLGFYAMRVGEWGIKVLRPNASETRMVCIMKFIARIINST